MFLFFVFLGGVGACKDFFLKYLKRIYFENATLSFHENCRLANQNQNWFEIYQELK